MTNIQITGKYGKNIAEVDEFGKGLSILQTEHTHIHAGRHFFISGYDTKNTGETIIFVTTVPDSTKRIHMTFSVSSTNILTVEAYEGASGITGGTSAIPVNNNRNSSNTSVLTVVKDPTSISDYGTLIDSFKFGDSSKFSLTGGEALRENELILKNNTTYVWKFTSGGDNNLITYRGSWYEVET